MIWVQSVLTPLRVAFFEEEAAWVAVESALDAVFLLDILFSFFSAYYNRLEVLVHARREIACAYLRSWFFIDFIAIVPLQLLTTSTLNHLGKLARVPRIYKLLKAAK